MHLRNSKRVGGQQTWTMLRAWARYLSNPLLEISGVHNVFLYPQFDSIHQKLTWKVTSAGLSFWGLDVVLVGYPSPQNIIFTCGWNVEGWIWTGLLGVSRVCLRMGGDFWGKKAQTLLLKCGRYKSCLGQGEWVQTEAILQETMWSPWEETHRKGGVPNRAKVIHKSKCQLSRHGEGLSPTSLQPVLW